MVTKLDRLARSVGHLLTIMDTLKAKGADLRILGMGISDPVPVRYFQGTIEQAVLEGWQGQQQSQAANDHPGASGVGDHAETLDQLDAPEPADERGRNAATPIISATTGAQIKISRHAAPR